jgi:hypothetical protein
MYDGQNQFALQSAMHAQSPQTGLQHHLQQPQQHGSAKQRPQHNKPPPQ